MSQGQLQKWPTAARTDAGEARLRVNIITKMKEDYVGGYRVRRPAEIIAKLFLNTKKLERNITSSVVRTLIDLLTSGIGSCVRDLVKRICTYSMYKVINKLFYVT